MKVYIKVDMHTLDGTCINSYIQKSSLCSVYIHISQGTVVYRTLYIGIAMVFVFSPYIRKFSSYFHFQVIVTFNDFIALNV